MANYLNLLSDAILSIEDLNKKADRFYSFFSGKNSRARTYDFKTALETLKTSSFQEIKSRVILALDKLNYYSIHSYSADFSVNKIDEVSMSLLLQSGVENLSPCNIKGDGNCLFRAVSKALYDNEGYHQELRFRCILELCLNLENYLNPDNYSNNKFVELIATVNPSSSKAYATRDIFQNEIIRTSALHSYASSLNLFGLANALSINIYQIYPDRDFRDPNFKSLLTDQISPFMKPGLKNIFIMWTHFCDINLRSDWAPNHFTCCLESDIKKLNQIKRENISLDSVKDLQDENTGNKIKKNYKRILITSDTENEELDFSDSSKLSIVENKNENNFQKSSSLNIKEAISLIFKQNAVSYLPKSVTKNSDFVIDMTKFKHKNILSDDNGSYKHYASKTYLYEILKGEKDSLSISNIKKINSKDFVKKDKKCQIKVDKKNIYFIRKQFYQNNSCDSLKRYLFILYPLFNDKRKKCLLSYRNDNETQGTVIKIKAHGNSKKNPTPYLRSSASVIERTKDLVKQKGSIKKNYIKHVNETAGKLVVSSKPRNLKQHENHYFLEVSRKRERPLISNDEYLEIICKIKESNFIKTIHFDDSINIICFFDEQYQDILKFCTYEKSFSVLSFDTTFNLGNFYVSFLTYRNLTLLNEKKTHPVFIGPMSSNNNTPISDVTNSSSELKTRKVIEPRSWAKVRYFTKNSDNSFNCSLCFKVVKTYNNSSKMLIEHLKILHDVNKESLYEDPGSVKKRRLDFDDSSEDDDKIIETNVN
ncbi:unnamed protein product [Brachionus calyciflorus]|uniref:Vertnin n=1 Tax=Brachionus calyciflorus TaxID=104777 RepID=A0A814E4Q1_9BILA|nr:unnamed protein product [Brachionus calyciflorus]